MQIEAGKLNIGILALQGAFLEHEIYIKKLEYNTILATSFHPELTKDLSFHKYFTDICYNHRI
ncbi:Glutamine amidotransferase subunit PdxT [Clostridium tertium]|uniref:Glutamine amidotransferase subunit PdxT n=1 Tax=Clostridium tertium TaxID=1559 RepID=A0A6N2Z0G6_9CLOT